jgi:hypothetical protein
MLQRYSLASPAQITAVKRRTPILALTAALLASTCIATADAQTRDRPAGSPGRFQMQPTDNGVLRLDTQTGAVSHCKPSGDTWACQMVPDERRALEDENTKLKQQVTELKDAVLRLEELMGVGENPKKGGSWGTLPNEKDLSEAADYVRGMVKKLKEKIKEFEDDMKDTPAPKRT